MDMLPVSRALLSVTDKGNLVEFASFLSGKGVQLVSTGGTAKAIAGAGLPVTQVSEVTGFPEMLDGRVKTLNPRIHGGILADKDNPTHLNTLKEHNIEAFDLICVNLYDFAKAAAQGLGLKDAVEQIDIGGPCMLRAAAKNFHSVAVVPSPEWYDRIMAELAANGMRLSLELRRELAQATFAATSRYDAMIAEYLAK